jgi:hypothetical protein
MLACAPDVWQCLTLVAAWLQGSPGGGQHCRLRQGGRGHAQPGLRLSGRATGCVQEWRLCPKSIWLHHFVNVCDYHLST